MPYATPLRRHAASLAADAAIADADTPLSLLLAAYAMLSSLPLFFADAFRRCRLR